MFNKKLWELTISHEFTQLINGVDKDEAIKALEETKDFIDVMLELLKEDK